jgi:undecaprenyl diphosphate synthase
VQHLVVYALSTENLKRTPEEVSYSMKLIIEAAETKLAELSREGVRIRAIGDLAVLPTNVQDAVRKAEKESESNTKITLWLALAYGGRAEIVAAARAAVSAGKEITKETLPKYFWSAEMPEPDVIIRPGGEKRFSGFLLWQSEYAELFFLDTMWPDFTKADLEQVLKEYSARERRRGK